MPASTYAGNAFLNQFLRGIAPSTPGAVYVSLHTANPGNAGANEVTLVAWPGYARVNAAGAGALSAAFAAATAKTTTNANDLLWPANDGAAPVTVTHFALWTAATAGECLVYGPLDASKTLNVTDELMVYASKLTVPIT